MRWTREEYIDLMTFGNIEKQVFCELFGPLVGLEKEWTAQGAAPDEIDMIGFDWDYVDQTGFGGSFDILLQAGCSTSR